MVEARHGTELAAHFLGHHAHFHGTEAYAAQSSGSIRLLTPAGPCRSIRLGMATSPSSKARGCVSGDSLVRNSYFVAQCVLVVTEIEVHLFVSTHSSQAQTAAAARHPAARLPHSTALQQAGPGQHQICALLRSPPMPHSCFPTPDAA
jgi:hypothetical protein